VLGRCGYDQQVAGFARPLFCGSVFERRQLRTIEPGVELPRRALTFRWHFGPPSEITLDYAELP
jgi:hypothetical protein